MTDRPERAAPVTLVLSRQVRAGHEEAFEDVLHRLAAEVARQPGHLDVTVLRPSPGGRRIYTIVSHFASRADADAWLSSEVRARLVAALVTGAATGIGKAIAATLASAGAQVIINHNHRTGKSEQFLASLEAMSAFGRLGQPDEIAAVVTFLASDAARWITAQNIRVNGGTA